MQFKTIKEQHFQARSQKSSKNSLAFVTRDIQLAKLSQLSSIEI